MFEDSLKSFSDAAPWITLVLLLCMIALISNRMTVAPGVVCDLPASSIREGETPDLTVMIVPAVSEKENVRGTLVFFDDARYSVEDPVLFASFRKRLAERVAADETGNLLVLGDRRISAGALMKLVDAAREAGVNHLQIAERPE